MVTIERITKADPVSRKYLGSEWILRVAPRHTYADKQDDGRVLSTESESDALEQLAKRNAERAESGNPPLILGNPLPHAFRLDACHGDTIENEIDGLTVEAEIVPDPESRPDDTGNYDQSDIDAWNRDDWCFCGIVVRASRNGRVLGDASLWGIELSYGNLLTQSEYLTRTAIELIPDAIAEAETTLNGIDQDDPDCFEDFWRGALVSIAFTSRRLSESDPDDDSPCSLWDPGPGGDYCDSTDPDDVVAALQQCGKLAEYRAECLAFLRSALRALLLDPTVDDIERAGSDFHLTRNRHGCGFWDGDWTRSLASGQDQGDSLTELARPYGTAELFWDFAPDCDPDEWIDAGSFTFDLINWPRECFAMLLFASLPKTLPALVLALGCLVAGFIFTTRPPRIW